MLSDASYKLAKLHVISDMHDNPGSNDELMNRKTNIINTTHNLAQYSTLFISHYFLRKFKIVVCFAFLIHFATSFDSRCSRFRK